MSPYADDVSRFYKKIGVDAAVRNCGVIVETKTLRLSNNRNLSPGRKLGEAAGERKRIEHCCRTFDVIAAWSVNLPDHRDLETADLADDDRYITILDIGGDFLRQQIEQLHRC